MSFIRHSSHIQNHPVAKIRHGDGTADTVREHLIAKGKDISSKVIHFGHQRGESSDNIVHSDLRGSHLSSFSVRGVHPLIIPNSIANNNRPGGA
jgi:hypothetical protein